MKNQNKSIHNFPNFFMLFAPLLSSIIYLVYNLYKRNAVYNQLLKDPFFLTVPIFIIILILITYYIFDHSSKKILKAILWYSPLMISFFYFGLRIWHSYYTEQSGLNFSENIALFGLSYISFFIMGIVLSIYLIKIFIRRGNKS